MHRTVNSKICESVYASAADAVPLKSIFDVRIAKYAIFSKQQLSGTPWACTWKKQPTLSIMLIDKGVVYHGAECTMYRRS